MNSRENTLAVLSYQPYEKMPVVSFGYWAETVDKWAEEGHIPQEWADDYKRSGDNGAGDRSIMARLGFDYNWNSCIGANTLLHPASSTRYWRWRPMERRLSAMGRA